MPTSSSTRKAMPEAPLGSRREVIHSEHTIDSHKEPTVKQLAFRLGGAFQHYEDVAMLRAAFKRAVEVAGGVEWLAIELGKPLSYASKISEALNGVEGRHIQFEEWLPPLFSCWAAMEVLFSVLCDRTNREHPKAKKVASDGERISALLKVLGKAGPAGEALIKAAADEIGVDVEGLVR
jgi:hypothetical protein